MNKKSKTLEEIFEERRRIRELFSELWEIIGENYFPELKNDGELADYVLTRLMEEIKERQRLKKAMKKGMID
jgi:hypothetical protein